MKALPKPAPLLRATDVGADGAEVSLVFVVVAVPEVLPAWSVTDAVAVIVPSARPVALTPVTPTVAPWVLDPACVPDTPPPRLTVTVSVAEFSELPRTTL